MNMSEHVVAGSAGKDFGDTLGFLLIRLWLSVRAVVTGIEKFAVSMASETPVVMDGTANTYGLTASSSEKVYSLSSHHGIPEVLYAKLQAEPLLPGFALRLLDASLGPVLIVLGLSLLLGLCTRISLFLMGLIYTSLTVGLILLKQDAGVAWLGIHVLLVAFALSKVRHNRFALTRKY